MTAKNGAYYCVSRARNTVQNKKNARIIARDSMVNAGKVDWNTESVR